MRRYETIFIIDPDIPDENKEPIYERIGDIIEHQNGFLARTEKWGNKRLAYDIKKKARGYYIRLDYCGTGSLIDEIERFFRIDDRILKYMTIVLEKDADLDQIKDQIAQEEALEAEKHQQDQDVSDQPDQPDEDLEAPLSNDNSGDEVVADTEEEPEAASAEDDQKEQ